MNQQGSALQAQQKPEGDDKPPGDAPGADLDAQKPGETGDDFNDIELLAMEMGWNPDHEGDRSFVDARTFILRGGEIQKTMQHQISNLKQQGEEFQEAMVNLRDHYAKLSKVEAGKIDIQIGDLEKDLVKAVEDADVKKVQTIQTQINNLQAQKREAETAAKEQKPETKPAQPSEVKLTPAAQTWLNENPWYNTDAEMRAYADAQSDRFRGLPEDRYFIELTKAVKQMYPDRFPAPRRRAAVEPGGRKPQVGGGKKKFTMADLSDDQKRLANFYSKQGVMKPEEYIEELVRIGELG